MPYHNAYNKLLDSMGIKRDVLGITNEDDDVTVRRKIFSKKNIGITAADIDSFLAPLMAKSIHEHSSKDESAWGAGMLSAFSMAEKVKGASAGEGAAAPAGRVERQYSELGHQVLGKAQAHFRKGAEITINFSKNGKETTRGFGPGKQFVRAHGGPDGALSSLVSLVAVSPFSGVLVGVFNDVNVFIEQCIKFGIGDRGYHEFLAANLESINIGVEGSAGAEHAAQPKDLASLILPGQVDITAIKDDYRGIIIQEIHRKELIPITRTENYIKSGTSIFRCWGGTTLSMRPNTDHCRLVAQKIIGIPPYDGINGSSQVRIKMKGAATLPPFPNSTRAQLWLLGEYYKSREFEDNSLTPQTPNMFVEHLVLKMEQTANYLGQSMMALDTLAEPYTVVSPITGTPIPYKAGTPLCALVSDLVKGPGHFEREFKDGSNEKRVALLNETQSLRDALEMSGDPRARPILATICRDARSHLIMGTAHALSKGILATQRERLAALLGPPSAFGAAASAFGAAPAAAAAAAPSALSPSAADADGFCELVRLAADELSLAEKFEGADGITVYSSDTKAGFYKTADSLQCLADVAVAASCLGAGGAGAAACSVPAVTVSERPRMRMFRSYDLAEDGHSPYNNIYETLSGKLVAQTADGELLDKYTDSQIETEIARKKADMVGAGDTSSLPMIGGRYPSKKSKRSKNGTQHKRIKMGRVLSRKLNGHHLHRSHRKPAAKSRRYTQRRKSNK